MEIIITGAAGFIGFHLCKRLLSEGWTVIGIDNLNSYYDVNLKYSRLEILKRGKRFNFYKYDLTDKESIFELFNKHKSAYVINLAAQAGVRYSLENPFVYVDSNVKGFLTILEACKEFPVKHLIYASSSSVYGANTKIPFSEKDRVDTPISLYAATKKTNELFAYTYASLFGIPSTGLRFFTVYGEWGRPDMACYIFTKNIMEGKPITLFNYGKMRRDFTYVDDLIEGIVRLIGKPPCPPKNNGTEKHVPHQIFNIGNNSPVDVKHVIEIIENRLNKKSIIKYLPMQMGDVPVTFADTNNLAEYVGYTPSTPIEIGLTKFITWFKKYHRVRSKPSAKTKKNTQGNVRTY